MLSHVVLFWLKKDISQEQVDFFEKQLEKLEEIQSVSQFYFGKPADTPKRPVIDDSYSYSINVILKDMEAHDLYQQDPIHQAFIKDCSFLWDKVRIYDFS